MSALFTSLAVLLLTGLDQLLKHLVRASLRPAGTLLLIPGVLQLHYSENNGAMMGLLPGKSVLMAVLSLLLLGVVFYLLFFGKIKSKWICCALVGVFAGGLGNLIDRVHFGYVIDYIEVLFVRFYIFNFADCLVTVGAFMILLYELRSLALDFRGRKAKIDG